MGLLVRWWGQNVFPLIRNPDYAQELSLPPHEYLLYLLRKLSCVFTTVQVVGVLCAMQMG